MYFFFRVTYRIVILSFFLQFILYIILESLLNKKLFVKRSIMSARIICIYFSRLNFFASGVIWFTMMWIDRYRKPLHRITRYIIYERIAFFGKLSEIMADRGNLFSSRSRGGCATFPERRTFIVACT